MTTYLRCHPGETEAEFIQRVVEAAPRPNPDQLDRLVALLRSGRTHGTSAAEQVEPLPGKGSGPEGTPATGTGGDIRG